MKNNTLNKATAEREKVLIAIIQSGQEDKIQTAFNELYKNRKEGLLFDLKGKLKCNQEDAEDVIQETFTKVWRSIHTYDGSTNFSTWLYAIAKNALIDHIRKQKHEIIRFDSMKPTLNGDSDSFKDKSFQFKDTNFKNGIEVLTAKENAALVHKAIASIKKSVMRDIVYMKYIEQLSGNEICAKLNMPVGTYKANNYRAETLIRKYIISKGFDSTAFKGRKKDQPVEVEADEIITEVPVA